MKTVFSLFTVSLFLFNNIGCDSEKSSCDPIYTWKLKHIFEVEGRQGIAADGDFYYVSGTTALYKYSKSWNLISSNTEPFKNFEKSANHIGDIEVYKNEIFAGCETFLEAKGENIQIAVYNTYTLEYKRSIYWELASGQLEVCGLTVQPDGLVIWLSDWVNGNYLYKYDLKNEKYIGKLHLQPVPQYQQGILYMHGYIFISADDGDAENDEDDHLYRVTIESKASRGGVFLEKTFSEFRRTGEIEGITEDPVSGEFLVLFNRGTRVVSGIPRGFYPGYQKEIHEVYVFDKKIN